MSSTTPTSANSKAVSTSTSTGSKSVAGTGFGTTSGATTGTTTISDAVVSKIAGIAAREVPGVHDLGGAAGRAIGAIRSRINQTDLTQGISVEVGEKQVAVDVTLVAEYPMNLQQIADEVRSSITDAIETYVGREVTEVNVTVTDVFIPSDDEDDDSKSRVQ